VIQLRAHVTLPFEATPMKKYTVRAGSPFMGWSFANAIDNSGRVVGDVVFSGGQPVAYMMAANSVITIGGYVGVLSGDSTSSGLAIHNNGVVAGTSVHFNDTEPRLLLWAHRTADDRSRAEAAGRLLRTHFFSTSRPGPQACRAHRSRNTAGRHHEPGLQHQRLRLGPRIPRCSTNARSRTMKRHACSTHQMLAVLRTRGSLTRSRPAVWSSRT
jgi:uncharacterized membrane protein